MTIRRPLLAALGAALLLPAAAQAAPKEKPCPKAGKTLAAERGKGGSFDSRVWRRKGVVFGCSTFYPSYGRVTRLGRFDPRLVRVDGTEAIWTVRRDGADRVSAAELYSGGRRVRSRRAVPRVTAGGRPRAARVDAIRIDPNGVFAWIASTGDLVVGGQALDEPVTVTGPGGDVHTAFTDGNVAVVDDLGGLGAARRRAVVRRLRIDVQPGDGDECGYVNPVVWRWTSPLGPARAASTVSSTNPSC